MGNSSHIIRKMIPRSSIFVLLPLTFTLNQGVSAIRCYSDHAGPNSAGGIEVCDEGGVCSSSRIVFREEGVLRTAMSRHCVSRTHQRTWGSDWPWCHEEWAGGDEGGMEVYTCYCKDDLCNENTFLLAKFNEWISVTRARLKAGPSHPLDIVINIATFLVGGFFILVILSQVPWAKFRAAKGKEEQEEESEEEAGETETAPDTKADKKKD